MYNYSLTCFTAKILRFQEKDEMLHHNYLDNVINYRMLHILYLSLGQNVDLSKEVAFSVTAYVCLHLK